MLMGVCVLLTVLIGFRDGWPDEEVYIAAFKGAPPLYKISFNETPLGYVEKGYLYLASLVKAIYDDWRFYLLAMGGLSMFLLYKSLEEYCALPLIGLCDYVARFLLNRDFIQMRSSLAILLIVLAMKFIYERKAAKYFLVVLLAYQFHHMALLGIPVYFLCQVRISRRSILLWLMLAFILSQTLAETISENVDAWSEDLNYQTYTEGMYVERALGLANPMIYLQLLVLLLFTLFESDLCKYKYYYVIRTGYFYSTFILIFFCNYTALSGRTSTLFATYEMFMLPMIIAEKPKSVKWLYYAGIGLALSYFFYAKYADALLRMNMVILLK